MANEEPHRTWEPVAMQTASCAGKVYVVGSQDKERVCRDCGEARSGPVGAHSPMYDPPAFNVALHQRRTVANDIAGDAWLSSGAIVHFARR